MRCASERRLSNLLLCVSHVIIRLFSGRVHATDYSNASATGIFDSYQVGCTPCYLPFHHSVCLVCFFLISARLFHRCAGVSFSVLWSLYLSPSSPKWKTRGESFHFTSRVKFVSEPSWISQRWPLVDPPPPPRLDLMLSCSHSHLFHKHGSSWTAGFKVQLFTCISLWGYRLCCQVSVSTHNQVNVQTVGGDVRFQTEIMVIRKWIQPTVIPRSYSTTRVKPTALLPRARGQIRIWYQSFHAIESFNSDFYPFPCLVTYSCALIPSQTDLFLLWYRPSQQQWIWLHGSVHLRRAHSNHVTGEWGNTCPSWTLIMFLAPFYT